MLKFLKLILYQKPKPTPNLFESGLEDRLGHGDDFSQNAGNGQLRGHFAIGDDSKTPTKQEVNTKWATTKGRYARLRTDQPGRQSKTPPVQQKFADNVAKHQAIAELLHKKQKLSTDLKQNQQVLNKIFRLPRNKEIVLRQFTIGVSPKIAAFLVYLDGATNTQLQDLAVLQPLMLLSSCQAQVKSKEPSTSSSAKNKKQQLSDDDGQPKPESLLELVERALVPANQVGRADDYARVVEDVLSGNSALFIEGLDQALLLETRGWQYRGISTPQVETVIHGPQEAFTEQIKANTSLVRKILHRPSLVTEYIKVGDASTTQCAIMYLDDVVNPDLVAEVKRRLTSIRADYVQQSGLLEQLIEDNPYSFIPQTLATERPDRVAANLMEGHVAIFIESNPFVLVVPTTFFALMQSSEDAYVRWPFDSFGRMIRYAGLLLALLLPAHYVAIAAFHQEFIPTDLLLVMTGAREKVPFPSIVEVLMMELSFELIREAGVRVPGTVGTTLGIVGALILGQAAVAANIVSPILIIVVAVTALGSFAIPNYGFSLSVRVLRFVYIMFASVLGLLGIMVVFFIQVGLMVNLKSFGIPFMAPAAPVTRKNKDYFMRGREWEQEWRPDALDPIQKRRQPRISRRWMRPLSDPHDQGDEN